MYLVIKSDNGRRSAYIMDTEDAALEKVNKLKARLIGKKAKVFYVDMEKESERTCESYMK